MIPIDRVISKLDSYYAKNDTVSAERHIEYWIAEAVNEKDYRNLMTLYSEGMGFYRKAGNKEKAYSCVGKMLNLISSTEAGDSVSSGTFYINCATVYTAFGEPDNALPLFEKADRIYKENITGPDERYASLYNNMSMCYLKLKRFEEADIYCLKALHMMEKIPGHRPEVAVSWLNLCNVHEAQKGLLEACEEISEYLDHAESELDSEDNLKDGNYAFVCSKCAPVFEYYGRFAYAIELKERADKIYAGA